MKLDNLISIARSDIGLTATDPAFANVIACGETDARRAEFLRYAAIPWGSFSCCGLAALGWVRRAARADTEPKIGNDDWPRAFMAPYRAPWEDARNPGAIGDLLEGFKRVGGLRRVPFNRWQEEECGAVDPGMLLVVGDGKYQHVYLVEAVHDDYMNEIHLDAIESGVRDKRGVQCVKRRRHIINENGYDSVVENGVLVNQRKVAYILNPGVL